MTLSLHRRTRPYSLAGYLTALPRSTKRFIMLLADGAAMPLAAVLGLWLVAPQSDLWRFAWFWLATSVVSLAVFHWQGLYRSIVHLLGLELLSHAFRSVAIACALLLAIVAVRDGSMTAVKFGIVFSVLGLTYVTGSRFMVRLLLRSRNSKGDRVLIYGAGEAGAHLANALMGRPDFVPVGFVDDNISLQGTVINGLEVNVPARLNELVDSFGVSRVLLALPSVTRRRRRQIINRLEDLPVHVQTMPDISDLISGNARIDEIREVDVADLLGRDAVPPKDALMGACIRAKTVMVTGAGGSIGAELCRNIIGLRPTTLVLYEIAESALYTVHRELCDIASREDFGVEIVPLLGSCDMPDKFERVCRAFGVQTIYHAAAYKHVPLVEHNMIDGTHNNVFGTLYAAEAAIAAGVESFVLISTDKAVQPTSVMGATKRLAELILQGLSERSDDTVFSMVRFGNVLASSGSVVPLFREQIRGGGPVTVTHPEIYRYFMTISEAAQLVIQAGSMAKGGDVFVLDMGQPVRIADLAEKMIHLMGLTVRDEDHPDGDIEIKYTGLRPAEKLYEELLIGNNVSGTDHPMIMRAEEKALPWHDLRELLDDLRAACRDYDCEGARALLRAAVAEYKPSIGLEDLVWVEQNGGGNRAGRDDGNVTELRPRSEGVRPGKVH